MEEKTKRCPYCGEKIKKDLNICPICGEELQKIPNLGNKIKSFIKKILIVILLGSFTIIGYFIYNLPTVSYHGTCKYVLNNLNEYWDMYYGAKPTDKNEARRTVTGAYVTAGEIIKRYPKKDSGYALKGYAALVYGFSIETGKYLSRIKEQEKYFEEARELSEKALSINPNNAVANMTLGWLDFNKYRLSSYLKNDNDLQSAISYFQKAVDQKPKFAEPYLELTYSKSILADKNGKHTDEEVQKEFVSNFSLAIKYSPKRPDLYLYRAMSKSIIKNYEGALKDINMAIKISAEEKDLYYEAKALIEKQLRN